MYVFLVSKSINNFIIDIFTNIPKIIDKNFNVGAFSFISPLINLILME